MTVPSISSAAYRTANGSRTTGPRGGALPPAQRQPAVGRTPRVRQDRPVPTAQPFSSPNGRSAIYWPGVFVAIVLFVVMIGSLVGFLWLGSHLPAATTHSVKQTREAAPVLESLAPPSHSHLVALPEEPPKAPALPAPAEQGNPLAPSAAPTGALPPLPAPTPQRRADSKSNPATGTETAKAPPAPAAPDTAPATCDAGTAAAKVGEPAYETFGTSVNFLRSPAEAAREARKEDKLLFVLHIAGNFEDDRFT